MRQAVLAFVLMLVSAMPAHAGESRVVLDATVMVTPGDEPMLCMDLPPGTVAATTRLIPREDEARQRPESVEIYLFPYRGLSEMPGIEMTATTAEATYATPIIGGLHCLRLVNLAVVPAGQNVNFRAQRVALKLTIEPS